MGTKAQTTVIDDLLTAGALASEDAVWILSEAVRSGGALALVEVEQHFGSSGQRWLALGRLMRAGYIREGSEKLHISLKGRRALERREASTPAE